MAPEAGEAGTAGKTLTTGEKIEKTLTNANRAFKAVDAATGEEEQARTVTKQQLPGGKPGVSQLGGGQPIGGLGQLGAAQGNQQQFDALRSLLFGEAPGTPRGGRTPFGQ